MNKKKITKICQDHFNSIDKLDIELGKLLDRKIMEDIKFKYTMESIKCYGATIHTRETITELFEKRTQTAWCYGDLAGRLTMEHIAFCNQFPTIDLTDDSTEIGKAYLKSATFVQRVSLFGKDYGKKEI